VQFLVYFHHANLNYDDIAQITGLLGSIEKKNFRAVPVFVNIICICSCTHSTFEEE